MPAKLDITKPLQIIGLQLFENTDISVRKSLEPGWYPLINCENPIGTDMNIFPVVSEDICPLQYYQHESIPMPTVSVSAIVGKNGAGKTTLVELIYRILNNFAETLLTPKGADHCDFVEHAWGLHARLYFMIDGVKKFIECNDFGTFYYEVNNDNVEQIKIQDLTEEQIKSVLNGFFYTISLNYSLYANNSADYDSHFHNRNELFYGADWIDKLYHKNDGYYLPIVLTPERSNGQINVNNENRLAEQRLSILALLFHSQGKEFLEDYVPESIQYRLNEKYRESKIQSLLTRPFFTDMSTKIQEFFINHMEDAWGKVLADRLGEEFDVENDIKVRTTVFYLAFKSIKIIASYPKYKDLIPFDLIRSFREPIYDYQKDGTKVERKDKDGNVVTSVIPVKCIEWANANTDVFVRAANALFDTEINHITAKLHQCLYFLRNGIYTGSSGVMNVDYDILNNTRYDNYDDVMMLLPPAYFYSELLFKKKGKGTGEEDFITFRKMSSGERQMYYSMSYVLYHIHNIAGIKENGKRAVGYHHINLILDEAELYYHPEYQRKFVSSLISDLAMCHIKRNVIRSINVIIITHSPFILSDIPDTNILFLNKEESIAEPPKTLGANIYDLLRSGFFLDYAIGDSIQGKLQKYLKVYHIQDKQSRESEFQKIKNEMLFVVNHLGEPYLHDTFLRIYHEMAYSDTKSDIRARIQELEKQKALLESKLRES